MGHLDALGLSVLSLGVQDPFPAIRIYLRYSLCFLSVQVLKRFEEACCLHLQG